MSHLALLNHQTQAIKYPQAIFQTVSPRTWVNKGKRKGRGCYAPALRYGCRALLFLLPSCSRYPERPRLLFLVVEPSVKSLEVCPVIEQPISF
jgi:hypothetical protein